AETSAAPSYLILSVSDRGDSESRDAFQVKGLVDFLAAQVPYPIAAAETTQHSLPRHRAGYDAVRAIVFDATAPESLDGCQRQAILDYLLAGGALLLSAPLGSADPTGTWLEQYIPVRIIGKREADRVDSTGDDAGFGAATTAPSGALKFREAVPICEAAPLQ